MKDSWYPLDNAAQIFPIISKKGDTNAFRFSAVLYENVDPLILKEALKESLFRFPMFSVRLRKGVFWYYFEQNDKEAIVREEDPYFCESNDYVVQNDYLFNLAYYEKRISIEIFHGLSDGTGGMEFFKAILFHYLKLKGFEIENSGEILTKEVESLAEETQDSFKYNYNNKTIKIGKEESAFKIEGDVHKYNWIESVETVMDLNSLKEVSKKYSCTITQFIASVLVYNIYYTYYINSNSKKPIKLFIPVDARKYFDSKTLRNFVLFMRTNSKFNGEISLEQVVKNVKETFDSELTKEKMLSRIKTNVKLEKNIFVRFLPLPIKALIVRLCFKLIGTDVNTTSFSNLGNVDMPDEMKKHIDRIDFANGASKDTKISATLVSFNNKAVLTFSSVLIERKLQASVINMLQGLGVKLVVATNDLEV